MPAIDAETGELILRVAYDGASRAGKTTNLTILSQKLERSVVAPDQVGERTIYFDWMHYRAGNFEGRSIRCELLSAPGQELLAQRRDILLSTADAVVMVVDLSELDLEAVSQRVAHLLEHNESEQPPAVLVQGNKCDLAAPQALDALRDYCKRHDPPLMLTQATAREGTGVRETFVLAVRLAVVRAHALRRAGAEFATAQTMDAETMLKWLRTQESLTKAKLAAQPPKSQTSAPKAKAKAKAKAPPPPPAALETQTTEVTEAIEATQATKVTGAIEATQATEVTEAIEEVEEEVDEVPGEELDRIERTIDALREPSQHPYALLAEGEQGSIRPPDPPRSDVPEGMVWPPVTGRAALQDISAQDFQVEAVAGGGFFATVKNCWEIHSAADAVFHSPVTGMEQLLEWAKQHSQLSEVLSGPRCIVFSPVDNRQGKRDHAWRLWQIVRVHRSVRDKIASLLDEDNPMIIADSLIEAGACILHVESMREDHPLLPASTLESVGERLSGGHYVGLLPGPKTLAATPEHARPGPKEVLARELAQVVLQDWRDNASKITREIRVLARDYEEPRKKIAAQVLFEVLNEHRRKANPIRLWSRALLRR